MCSFEGCDEWIEVVEEGYRLGYNNEEINDLLVEKGIYTEA